MSKNKDDDEDLIENNKPLNKVFILNEIIN
jgi:hypothetical protein